MCIAELVTVCTTQVTIVLACSANEAVAEVAGAVRENIKLRRGFRSVSYPHTKLCTMHHHCWYSWAAKAVPASVVCMLLTSMSQAKNAAPELRICHALNKMHACSHWNTAKSVWLLSQPHL